MGNNKLNPCYELCYLRYQKKYDKEKCSKMCEFANVCDERNKLQRFKKYFDSLYEKGLNTINLNECYNEALKVMCDEL